jgi:hypothetical protein
MTAPHLPAALGARVHVEGHGLGTYVRFDFNLSRVAHTIDFDEGGEKMLRSNFPCRDNWFLRRLCCCSATRPVADGWQVVKDLGSIQVFTLMAPEPQTIVLTANMSICELRSEVARCFEVPPEQQQLVAQGEAGDQGDAGTEGSGREHGELVGEGSDPSTTVWRSGVRAGMCLLLVATDSLVAAGEGTWSVERIARLQREGLQSEVARAKEQRKTALAIAAAITATIAATITAAAVGMRVLKMHENGIADSAVLISVVGVVAGGVSAVSKHVNDVAALISVVGVVFVLFVSGRFGFDAPVVVSVVSVSVGVGFGVGAGVAGRRWTLDDDDDAAGAAAALEGRTYKPLSRTRVWGTIEGHASEYNSIW